MHRPKQFISGAEETVYRDNEFVFHTQKKERSGDWRTE